MIDEEMDVVSPELDEAICHECKGRFLLDPKEDPESCPLCGIQFD